MWFAFPGSVQRHTYLSAVALPFANISFSVGSALLHISSPPVPLEAIPWNVSPVPSGSRRIPLVRGRFPRPG